MEKFEVERDFPGRHDGLLVQIAVTKNSSDDVITDSHAHAQIYNEQEGGAPTS